MASSAAASGPAVVQGIDTLTAALKSNIIPDQEYLLQGSVMDQHVDVLRHRLRGLCDNADEAGSGGVDGSSGCETFHEREMVFSIQGTASQPLCLRVRRPAVTQTEESQQSCWQLRYIGQPELVNRSTVVRSCYDIACGENAVEFLTELGCRLDYEFVARGFLFRKGRMKVTVSKIFRVSLPGGPTEEPLTQSHLVELSVLAPSGSDAVADDMKNFSEQLKPLVMLDKIDPARALRGM